MITVFDITLGIFTLFVIIIAIIIVSEKKKDKRFEDKVLRDIKEFDQKEKKRNEH